MSGIAGESLGLGAANPNPIGGLTKVTADGGTVGRGCVENFIGFGLGATSVEPLPEDFNTTDDAVTLAATGNAAYEPDYAASATPNSEVLSWVAA